MGFLSMMGLVTAEEYAKMELERDAALAKAAKEEATGVKTALNLGDANKKIAAQKVEIYRLSRGWDKCGDDLRVVRGQLAKFHAKRERDNAKRRERHARKATGAQKKAPARAKKAVR